MHIMSMLSSMADAVSSGSFPILFKALTLNVDICIVYLHSINFCLSSKADFSNSETLFYPRKEWCGLDVVWLWVMVIFRWLFLFSATEANLIDEQQ